MFELFWLIPVLPLAGALALLLVGRRAPRALIAIIGVAPTLGAAALSFFAVRWALHAPPGGFRLELWRWVSTSTLVVDAGFYLDPLSTVMIAVVSCVSFLILLYSAEYMAEDESFGRFLLYMNLFVGFMLILVLADNLLFLYLGWEGVGLCSYLLIGFWYRDPENIRAANKAFIVTRIGDTAFAIGLFLLFARLGTLDIQGVLNQATHDWTPGAPIAALVTLLLLGGALGKSAQLPLQVWLPDAMAGPTPVSALIHAATMVTAGVYLIARMHALFALAPAVQILIAAIGAATLVLGGLCACAQHDIKRVLAYSTMSQVGYMFLALGAGAWTMAIFHFMTHAFFKALLFLAAGVVVMGLGHERDIFKMGGLRRQMPVAFWTFLAGALSLSGLPLVTAGFYSKDAIIWSAWNITPAGPLFALAALLGVLLTALYAFRLVFLVFFGPETRTPEVKPGLRIVMPLITLAALGCVSGFVQMPRTLGGFDAFGSFLAPSEHHAEAGGVFAEALLQAVSGLLMLGGVYAAYVLYLAKPDLGRRWSKHPAAAGWIEFVAGGCGFDLVYDHALIRPYMSLCRILSPDWIDAPYRTAAALCTASHRVFSLSQNGRLRWYALGIASGAALLLAMVILL